MIEHTIPLTDDIEKILEIFQSLVPEYFASVDMVTAGSSGNDLIDKDTGHYPSGVTVIRCLDEDGNILFTYCKPSSTTYKALRAYVSNDYRTSGTATDIVDLSILSSAQGSCYGISDVWRCKHGIVLNTPARLDVPYYKSDPAMLIITKSNTGKTMFIKRHPPGSQTQFGLFIYSYVAITFGDVRPVDNTSTMITVVKPVERNVFQLSPFMSNSKVGDITYSPNAFYVIASPISKSYVPVPSDGIPIKDVIIGGVHYMTDGIFAIRDE